MKGKVGTMASATETTVLHSVAPNSPNPTLEFVIVSRKNKEDGEVRQKGRSSGCDPADTDGGHKALNEGAHVVPSAIA